MKSMVFDLTASEDIVRKLNFKKLNGLIPAVAQDARTKDVLMLAFVNDQALIKTLTTGTMHYWSRSRGRIWRKGEESQHTQYVKDAYVDCDFDSLLFQVEQIGNCCHTGHYTCFHNKINFKEAQRSKSIPTATPSIMEEVFGVILDRLSAPRPASYVASLTSQGEDKILRKVSEEVMELVLTSKANDKKQIVSEAADVIFHIMVLLAYKKIDIHSIFDELKKRRK